jgi:hypothetical protein
MIGNTLNDMIDISSCPNYIDNHSWTKLNNYCNLDKSMQKFLINIIQDRKFLPDF